MDAAALLQTLRERGFTLRVEDGTLYVGHRPGALTDDLRAAICKHKTGLLRLLSAGEAGQEGAVSSPAPRIPDKVAEEIRRIEADAQGLGWTHEELWEARFWNIGPDGVNRPGLAAVMFPGYRIAEVTREAIVLLAGPGEHRLTFRRWPALRAQGEEARW